MDLRSERSRRVGLESIGIRPGPPDTVHWNGTTPALYEAIVRRREGTIAHQGPIVVRTGAHTGRSPDDKFIVEEPGSKGAIWWGQVNRPFPEADFERLHQRQLAYLQDKDLYVQDCYVGADPEYRVRLRVITESAWQSLFARNLFLREPDPAALADFAPDFTILATPRFQAVPEVDATRSSAFILVHFARRLVLIGGTNYAGEIKKSAFTIMNYLLPNRRVMSMHCSANWGKDRDDVALFFGLSGTGKTTLSTAADRTLIGDDEHGWSDRGVFNIEGGCYAKVIDIRRESEPEIFETTRRFGTILENVGIDPLTRRLDLADRTLTENTRAAYPISSIPHADPSGVAGHPRNIVFLTYDAFGVLPPLARLTAEEAEYHFLQGYTSKVAGTEAGVGKEPKAVFSTCFGAPFMPLPPTVYAELLREKIRDHKVACWLINTGMTGGPYGVGTRMPIATTRAIVAAVLSGGLADVPTRPVPAFHLGIPTACPGVEPALLDPRRTWKDPAAYDARAAELAERFAANARQCRTVGA
jgi:phosphoenolpyruvate carboxykinase (ATP)